jgi:REP element-mobilizing transposase RayT
MIRDDAERIGGAVAGKDGAAPRQSIGWSSRGYLPHFDGGAVPQFITFRLADSLPQSLVGKWRQELRCLSEPEAASQLRRRIEEYLDRSTGAAWLRNPTLAGLTEEALRHFDGERYLLHAWTVMPNHVHALITPRGDHRVAEIIRSWKSYVANEAHKIGWSGKLWQREYFDRFIRNERHFAATLGYIEDNPVRAGLCRVAEEWRFGSARERRRREGF